MPETPLLELRNISKQYGHVQALTGVDFTIGRNEVVGLLGDNGAGKSTLVRIMSGIEHPDSGSFWRDGREVKIRSRKDSERLGIETIYGIRPWSARRPSCGISSPGGRSPRPWASSIRSI